MNAETKARSNFAQVRCTMTQEASGKVTVRMTHKQYADDWKDAVCVWHEVIPHHEPLLSLEDCQMLLYAVLGRGLLPQSE
jgi:hypothetical protein